MLQTPSILCRQTDFIRACAVSGKPVNIKKGQFLAPGDMLNVVEKAREADSAAGLDPDVFTVCERGASFGNGTLVSAMRSLAIMRQTPAPVVFDATPSVPHPGGTGSASAFPCSRELRSQRAAPASSWKSIRRPPPPRATVPTSFRSAACVSSSRALWRSTAS